MTCSREPPAVGRPLDSACPSTPLEAAPSVLQGRGGPGDLEGRQPHTAVVLDASRRRE